MAAIIDDPMNFDLTPASLARVGMPPIIAGDECRLRFQVLDESGNPVSLAGALVILTVRKRDAEPGSALFTRRSDTNITATAVKQIAIDADQVTAHPNGTGKGWYQINSKAEDENALITIAEQLLRFDSRIRFADATVRTHLRGAFQALHPTTHPVT